MINFNEIRNSIFKISKKDFPGGKLVVSIAIKNKSSWIGVNTKKSHPKMKKKFRNGQEGSCCHAEINAILQVPRQCRSSIELYVIRFLMNGNISMAKPCNYCQIFLSENDINFKNVFYSDWNWNGNWVRLSDCV